MSESKSDFRSDFRDALSQLGASSDINPQCKLEILRCIELASGLLDLNYHDIQKKAAWLRKAIDRRNR